MFLLSRPNNIGLNFSRKFFSRFFGKRCLPRMSVPKPRPHEPFHNGSFYSFTVLSGSNGIQLCDMLTGNGRTASLLPGFSILSSSGDR